jgi:hypothetical protein
MGEPIHNLYKPIPIIPTSLPHGITGCEISKSLITNIYQNPLTIISQREVPLKKKKKFK